MSYTFTNSEKTKQKGSEYETFAALYMFGVYPHKTKMQYILVDSFNDVSTADDNISEIYDIQSKGYEKNSQGQIGRFLFTLYKNYQSDFPFKEFLLFLETIDSSYLIKQKNIFSFSNFNKNDKERVKNGLYKEIKKRENKENLLPSEIQEIGLFLKKVKFIVNPSNKQNAVKKLFPIKSKKVHNDDFYISIFDEIRDKQSSLKNINIENQTIQIPSDVLSFNKHITKKDLDTLLINRIVGVELFQDNIPLTFYPYLQRKKVIDPDAIEDIIIECNKELSLMYFNKNNRKNVWKLIFLLIDKIHQNVEKNSEDILKLIPKELLVNVSLSEESVVYLISRIQEGYKYANN